MQDINFGLVSVTHLFGYENSLFPPWFEFLNQLFLARFKSIKQDGTNKTKPGHFHVDLSQVLVVPELFEEETQKALQSPL